MTTLRYQAISIHHVLSMIIQSPGHVARNNNRSHINHNLTNRHFQIADQHQDTNIVIKRVLSFSGLSMIELVAPLLLDYSLPLCTSTAPLSLLQSAGSVLLCFVHRSTVHPHKQQWMHAWCETEVFKLAIEIKKDKMPNTTSGIAFKHFFIRMLQKS